MLRDVLRTGAVQAFELAVGLVTLVLSARLLGPEGRGLLGVTVVWAGLFAAFGSLSLDAVVVNRAALGRGEDWFPRLFRAIARLYLLLLAVTVAAALLLFAVARERIFGTLPDYLLASGLALVPLLLWARYQQALLLALGQLGLRNRAIVVSNLIALAGLVVFVWLLGWSVPGALLAQGLASVAAAAIGLGLLLRAAARSTGGADSLATLARDGAKVHASAVGHYVYGSVDVVTLNSVVGATAVGWYQLALRLVGVGLALPSAVATVFRARMAGHAPRESWRRQRGTALLTMLATLAGGGLAWLLAPWIIPLLAGEDFRPSVDLFRALLPILFGRSLELLLVPQIFARGHFLVGSAVALALAGVSAGLFLWLIPAKGLDGAVLGALVAFALLPALVYLGWIWWFERDLRREAAGP
jgi:O-antigen/teichoic acid export membrane protein